MILRRGTHVTLGSRRLGAVVTLHRGRDTYDGRQRYAITLGGNPDSMVSIVFGDWWRATRLGPGEGPCISRPSARTTTRVYVDGQRIATSEASG